MEIAGQAAFLAPEVVRCRRGCVTYSMAGEGQENDPQIPELPVVGFSNEGDTGSAAKQLRAHLLTEAVTICFTIWQRKEMTHS